MAPAQTSRSRHRWWTPGLLVHTALVVVVLAVSPADPFSAPIASWADGALFSAHLVLSAPWWLFTIFFPGGPADGTVFRFLVLAPPVLNVLLHGAVVVTRRRRRPAVPDRAAGPPGRRWRPSPSTVFGLGAAGGALVWAAWLGWDHTASYDVITQQVESPYVSLQVLGCALSVGVVTAVLAHRWSPPASAAGVSAGFWFLWTADASKDETGLFLVGAVALGMGLVAGTAMGAALGRVARDHPRRAGART